MPAEYRIYLERQIVLSRAYGVLSALDLTSHQDRLAADPAFVSSMDQLYDLTQVRELDGVEATTIRRLAFQNPFTEEGRRAIVAPDDLVFGMARMFEMLAKESVDSRQIRVFRQLDDAARWLGLELHGDERAWMSGKRPRG